MKVRNLSRPLLITLAALVFAATTHANSNPEGYFINILSVASDGGSAILGNRNNPNVATLTCQGGFQAESFYRADCHSTQNPEISVSVENLFSSESEVFLEINGQESTLFLNCQMHDRDNPFHGAICKD